MRDGGAFQKVDAVTIPVPDLDAGLDFYGRVLGHRLAWRNDLVGQAGLRVADGDSELVLTTRQSYEPNWLVDDVPACVEVFLAHGGELVQAPFDLPVGRAAVVRDPFGNPVVLVDLSKGRYQTSPAGDVTGVRTEEVVVVGDSGVRTTCCHDLGMHTVYEAAGGSEGLRRLAGAWHRRVLADEMVSHAFSHGFHPHHTDRLAAYWAEALGGPTSYSDAYGDETSVLRMHSGNGPHPDMDQRAISCFDQALLDVGLAADEGLRHVLHDYFAWATTTTMARYHDSAADVPEHLSIPRWSWDGLQR